MLIYTLSNGILQIVKPASTVEDLETYFVHEGFEDEHGGQFFRLGIDARYVHLLTNFVSLSLCAVYGFIKSN